MKVLHIIWSAHFGGIERLVLDLVNEQQSAGIQASILFGHNKEGDFYKQFQKSRLNCYFLNLDSGYDIYPKKYLNAIQIMKKYNILHFHGFNPFIGICAIVSQKVVMYTEHGNFGFGRKRTLADQIKDILKRWFLNSYVNFISFNSQFTEKIAEKRFRFGDVQRSVIYNGIAFEGDIRLFGEIENDILLKARGKFIVGTTSRFAGFKRIDRLIKAFAEFQKRKETLLLLVGDGVLKTQLERQVKSLGISKKIIFAGYRHNVRKYQKLMDICVFSSENEAFGLAAVETLSVGKPTIVFKDGGGIIEVVGGFSKDDVVADIEHLVHRLEYYYSNRDKLMDIGQKRKEYAQGFDIHNMSKQFTAIYQEIA